MNTESLTELREYEIAVDLAVPVDRQHDEEVIALLSRIEKLVRNAVTQEPGLEADLTRLGVQYWGVAVDKV